MFEIVRELPIELWIGLAGLALALAVFFVLGQFEERATARSTLRQLDDYEIEDQRSSELLAPVRERLLGPVLAALAKAGGRLNPPEYVERVRQKHVQAGIASADKVERFLAMRILGFVFIPFWLAFALFLNPLQLDGLVKWGFAGLGAIVGAIGPASRLNGKVEARAKSIQRALPDVLDLLVISVEAGLGFEQAVDRVIQNVPGELADEFARVLARRRRARREPMRSGGCRIASTPPRCARSRSR